MAIKILIIDDEEALLEVTAAYLSKKGYEVNTATNGILGLESVREDRPDLILLDVLMPEMDGLEFYKELKTLEDFSSIPVLVVTGRGLMEDSFKALGVEDFIAKPFTPDELCSRIELTIQLIEFREKNKELLAHEEAAQRLSESNLANSLARRKSKSLRMSKSKNRTFIGFGLGIVFVLAFVSYFVPRWLVSAYDDDWTSPSVSGGFKVDRPDTYRIGDTDRTLKSDSLKDSGTAKAVVMVMNGIYKEHDGNGVLRFEYLYLDGDLIHKKTFNDKGIMMKIDRYKK